MRGSPIFVVLFAILLILWVGGFLVFHVASALIHLLLILAVISLIAHFVRRSAAS
ncbi:MAG TPA: lmo0937 family membrane protein [Bryobacteraceae bacterium]|nr:lmo0937 family membrane protein [Bryobacteraceae bacterium]